MSEVPFGRHSHKISLTLVDSNSHVAKTSFEIKFIPEYITPVDPPEPVVTEVQTVYEMEVENLARKEVIELFKSAQMEPITRLAEATIKFDLQLKYPESFNFTMINDTVLKVSVMPGVDSDPDQLRFNWTATDLTRT